ncbi:MAG: magnesium transporter, partial [Bacteroidales bacterium]|nr:magnesium transporter [Bacteroidales bacterium]
MIEITKQYIEELKDIILADDAKKALEFIDPLHASDIADLYDSISLEEATFLFLLLDNERAADVLVELDEDDRKELLKALPSEVIAKQFIDNMESDD